MSSWCASKPFLSPNLLRDRNFTIGVIIALIFGMLNFTPITLLPTLLQDLRGYPDSVIGLILSARGFGTLIGFVIMIFASRVDPRIPLAIGLALQVYAGWVMWQFDINLKIEEVMWAVGVQGLGVGLIWVPVSVIAFSTLAPKDVPNGTAVFHLLRNFGSSIHISLSIALVIRTAKINYAGMAESISPYNENLNLPWVRGLWSIEDRAGLMALSEEVMRQATMIGYLNSFAFFALTTLLALPLVFMARKPKSESD
jgi:DHA2 family multidrug resistance protein